MRIIRLFFVAYVMALTMALPLMAIGADGWFENFPTLVAKEQQQHFSVLAKKHVGNALIVEVDTIGLTREFLRQCLPGLTTTEMSASIDMDDPVAKIGRLSLSATNGGRHEFAAWLAAKVQKPMYWAADGYATNTFARVADFSLFLENKILSVGGGERTRREIRVCPGIVGAETVVKGAFSGKTFSNPFEKAFIAWVDDNSAANWGHPCRVVVAKDDLSAFVVWYATEPMTLLVDGKSVEWGSALGGEVDGGPFCLEAARSEVDALVNSSVADNLVFSGDASSSYAILISGGYNVGNNHTRYWGDVAAVYGTLTKKYGMPKSNIKVCVSDGTSSSTDISTHSSSHTLFSGNTSPLDLDGDGDADIAYSATRSSIQSVFTSLKNSLKSTDQLFVFVTDHGDQDDYGDCYVCLWGADKMSVADFAAMTKNIACPVYFAFEFCYSGAFVNTLAQQGGTRYVAAAAGVETSSAWNYASTVTGIKATTGIYYMNPWVYYFVGALRGVFPTVNTSPWADSSYSCSADTSGDSLVSMSEAFNYATAKIKADGYSESPCDGASASGVGAAAFVLKQQSGASVPTIPATPTVTISGTTLSWTAPAGAKYYKVYRTENPFLDPEPVTGWITATSCQISKPTTAVAYFYFVKAASAQDEATASAFNQVQVVTGTSSQTLLPYSTARNYITYDDNAEFHLYSSSAISATPYSQQLCMQNGTVKFTRSYYTSDGAISATVNGSSVANNPSISASSLTKWTMAVSATANTADTPRALAFFSNATTPSGWTGNAGGTYPQYYAMWIGRAHYIYQAGKSTVFVSTPDRDITADAAGGAYASKIVARPNATAWTASTTADWITLYRNSSTGCGTLGYVVSANETGSQRVGTITISGASKTGTITVTQPSATVSVDAPTISSVSTSYTSYAKVSWGEVSGAVSYNVYRSTSTTRPNSAIASGITNTYYNDTSADPGVAYYYWVEAVGASSSAVSASKSGYRAVSLSVGASAVAFGASGGGTNVSVSANTTWVASTENNWLTLESSSGNLTIVASANTSSETRSGTVLIKAGGSTAHPATKSITVSQTGCPAPVAPTISTVSTTYSSYAKVSWGSVSGAASYNVYRSTTTTKPSTAYASGVTTSYYYDYDATPGVTYYYWVEAVNSAGSATSTSQSGYRAVSLTVGSSAQSFEAGGRSTNVAVSANTSWSATSSETWITFTSSTGTSDGTLAYSVSPNTVTESRSGTITITAGGSAAHPKTVTISVSQAGAVIQPAPSNKEMQVAVSCDYLDFSPLTKYDGIPYWRVVSSSSFADGTALYADGLSSNQWVSAVTEVQGPCVVGWKWACATNGSLCAVQMYLDGKWYAQNNDGAWHVRYCEVTNGTHTLDWCFNQGRLNDNGVGGNACLDTITLYYQVSFDPNGGNGEAVAIADNFVWGTNDDGTTNRYYEVGTQLTLPGGDGLKRDGFDFAGWTVDGDATVYQAGDEYEIGFEPVVFTARWTESQKTVVKIAKPTKVQTLIYTGSSQQGYSNCDSRLTVSGTGSATAAGMYSVVFTLPAATATETFTWADDTTTAFTINWNIARRDVADSSVTFAAISDQTYTGGAITPTVTMTFGGAARTLGSDYTVAYSSNVNPGTAHVTVTGVGNFTGTKSLDFKIEKMPDPVPVDYVSVASETWYDDGLVFPFDPIAVYQSYCQPNDGGTVRTLVISNILDASLNADCFSPYMVKIGETEILMDANSKQMTLESGDVVDVTMNFYPNTRLAIWTFTAEGDGVVLNPGDELIASYSASVNEGVSCGTMIYATAYFIANGGTPVYSDTLCVCTVASQPDAPTGLSVSFDWNSSRDNYLVTLDWNKEWPDGTKYVIYRSSSIIIDWDNPYAETTDVSYTDPDEDLVGGATNYYAVCAYPDGPYIQGMGAKIQAVVPILLEPFTTNYYIEASGISVAKQVNITANHAWSFEKTTEGAWLHVQKVGTTLQFTADANTGDTRSCEVCLSAGAAIAVVTFIQAGPEAVTHTVTFNAGAHGKFAGDKTSVDVVVNDGAAATAPTLTVDSGWKFAAWDKAFDNVTADMTVTALYSEVPSDPFPAPVPKSMNITLYAQIYDRSTDAHLDADGSILAAFDANGECRGKVAVMSGPGGIRLYQLTIGYESSGERGVTLRLWDSASSEVLEIPTSEVLYASSQIVGSLSHPIVYTVGVVTQDITLNEGWNWVSTFLTVEENDVGTFFGDFEFADDDIVKCDLNSATYYDCSWYPDDFTIEPCRAYVVKKSSGGSETHTVEGLASTDSITVNKNWNWFGSCSSTVKTVADLQHSGGFADDDVIKGALESATYKNGSWYPSTLQLKPGVGYLAKLANGGELTFRTVASSANLAAAICLSNDKAVGQDVPEWKPVVKPGTFTVYARVKDSAGDYIEADGSLLAAFDANGECRGVCQVAVGPVEKVYQLNVGIESNGEPSLVLKVWNAADGAVSKLSATVSGDINDLIGTISTPVVYTIAEDDPTSVVPTPDFGLTFDGKSLIADVGKQPATWTIGSTAPSPSAYVESANGFALDLSACSAKPYVSASPLINSKSFAISYFGTISNDAKGVVWALRSGDDLQGLALQQGDVGALQLRWRKNKSGAETAIVLTNGVASAELFKLHHYLVQVSMNGLVSFYVDGTKVYSAVNSTRNFAACSYDGFSLGCFYGGADHNSFKLGNGIADDFRVFTSSAETCLTDDEVIALSESFSRGEVYPPLPDDATPEQLQGALKGSTDTRLAECITNGAVYNAYLDWAAAVTNSSGETVGVGAVKAAEHAWFSFAVASGVLITELPTSDDVKVDAFEPSAESGKFDFTVSVEGVTIGSQALKENLKQVFGLEGAASLDTKDFSSSNVDLTFGTPENGKVKFTAGPKDANAKAFFMKVKLTP